MKINDIAGIPLKFCAPQYNILMVLRGIALSLIIGLASSMAFADVVVVPPGRISARELGGTEVESAPVILTNTIPCFENLQSIQSAYQSGSIQQVSGDQGFLIQVSAGFQAGQALLVMLDAAQNFPYWILPFTTTTAPSNINPESLAHYLAFEPIGSCEACVIFIENISAPARSLCKGMRISSAATDPLGPNDGHFGGGTLVSGGLVGSENSNTHSPIHSPTSGNSNHATMVSSSGCGLAPKDNAPLGLLSVLFAGFVGLWFCHRSRQIRSL